MTVSSTGVKPLLLAGGSTGTKSARHLLEMPDGRPLYQHLIDLLSRACPEAPSIYISLDKDSQLDPFLQDVAKPDFKVQEAPPIAVIYNDLEPVKNDASGGSTAGLLAAHRAHPQATWLVVNCDCPLLDVEMLKQLRLAYKPPVTCLRDQDGICRPLVGIWSPEGLSRLAEKTKKGARGPTSTIEEVTAGSVLESPDNTEKLPCHIRTESDISRAIELLQERS